MASRCLGAEMKVGWKYLQCLCDFHDVRKAGVALAALDAADVGRVEFGHVCEGCLTEPALMTDGANRAAEGGMGRRAGHGRTICA
jgi:hypothetical protein